ncbi:lipocalin family protein [Myroides odoratus]|uniref:lipocalin family protein n=1 Tax=Myroides odoratus TaxID=256 RepID=UPI000765DA11|nr:lipocalin family protein [Myroides odoratus]
MKTKQTVLALAFVALAFASCKDQKEATVVEETPTVTEQPTPEVAPATALIGSWTQPNQANPNILQGFELKEDGTMVAVNDPAMIFTKWKLVDNTLVFESEVANNDPASVKISTYKYELVADKTLKLDVEGTIETFTKQ